MTVSAGAHAISSAWQPTNPVASLQSQLYAHPDGVGGYAKGTKGTDTSDNSSVEVVRTAYEAFIKGDLETVGNALAEDIKWHLPGRNPLSGART